MICMQKPQAKWSAINKLVPADRSGRLAKTLPLRGLPRKISRLNELAFCYFIVKELML